MAGAGDGGTGYWRYAVDWQQERGIDTLTPGLRVCHEQESGILDVSMAASVTTRNGLLDSSLTVDFQISLYFNAIKIMEMVLALPFPDAR